MNVDVAKALGLSCGCYTYHQHDCRYPDYTVDDLLSYLTAIADEQDGVYVSIFWSTDDADYHDTDESIPARHFAVERSVFDEDTCDQIAHWWSAPTLLEALEQAVLAVSS